MLLGRRSFPFKVSCNPGGPFLPCLELPPGIVGHAGCGGELLIGNKSLRFSIEKKSLDLRIGNKKSLDCKLNSALLAREEF